MGVLFSIYTFFYAHFSGAKLGHKTKPWSFVLVKFASPIGHAVSCAWILGMQI
jgi:hypothetical protein